MKSTTSQPQHSEHTTSLRVLFLGATGAVGGEALQVLESDSRVSKLTLLGRRPVENTRHPNLHQHKIDIFNPATYAQEVAQHDVAICTLGVGQPSKVSKEDFIKIDKDAVIDFAKACKDAGVQHFELLSSVGISTSSSSLYLRIKAELVEELKSLEFERLSIFQPSMILTPTNRYGFSQAIVLFVWPLLNPILFGGWKQYRGVKVADLGKAIAMNIFESGSGVEYLKWSDFQELVNEKTQL